MTFSPRSQTLFGNALVLRCLVASPDDRSPGNRVRHFGVMKFRGRLLPLSFASVATFARGLVIRHSSFVIALAPAAAQTLTYETNPYLLQRNHRGRGPGVGG